MAAETDTWTAANGRLNVSLKDSNGDMRSTYDVLSDVASQWNGLTKSEQNAVATAAAGKNQYEVFRAILNNFDTAIKATNESMSAQGSATRENERYLDSLQGHLSNLSSAWSRFSNSLINSGMIKFFLDAGTTILNVADTVGGKYVAALGLAALATKKLAASTAALKLLKTLTNPIGLAVAGGAALVAMTAALIVQLKNTKTATEELAESNQENLEKTQDNAKLAESYASKIDSLSKIENKNAYQKQLMADYVAKLNAIYPDLNLSYDKNTDTLNQNTDALTKNIQKQKEAALVAAYQENAQKSFSKAVEHEMAAGDFRLQAQEYQENLKGMQKGSQEYEIELAKLQKAQKDYAQSMKDMAGAELEGTKNLNLAAEKTGEFKKLLKEYEKTGKEVPQSVINGIQSGIYSMPMSNKDWDKLLNFDALMQSSEVEVPDTVLAGIQNGIYKMPTTEIGLEELVEFDASTMGLEGLGYEISDKFVKDFQKASENDQKLWNDTLKGVLEEATKDPSVGLKFEDIIQDDKKSMAEKMDDLMTAAAIDAGDNIEPTEIEIKADDTDAMKKATQVDNYLDQVAQPRTATLTVYGSISESFNAVVAKIKEYARNHTATVSVGKKAKGKRQGEQGGLAWLGDEGNSRNPKPELVQTRNGAYLAGTKGWELVNLNSDDIVYTASQTKRLLGNNNGSSTGFLPRFAKGKSAQEKYNEKVEKERSKFDAELETLEYKRDRYHWTEKKFNHNYTALVKKYNKRIDAIKVPKGVKGTSSVGTERHRDYQLALEGTRSDIVKDRIEGEIALLEYGKKKAASIEKDINKNKHLSATEKKEYIKDVYETAAKYNLEEYKNGNKTRAETLKSIETYYKKVGKKDATYYEMLNDLREADKDKQLDYLDTLQEKQDAEINLAKSYIQQRIDALQEQENVQDRLNEKAELEADLARARAQKIVVYQEGVGLVYQDNIEEITKAEKALADFNKSAEIDKWQDILELFDKSSALSDIKELELITGKTSLSKIFAGIDFSNVGNVNINKLADMIDLMYATTAAYADLSNVLGDAETDAIDKYLKDGKLKSGLIDDYIKKHSYASGTMSASGGWSIVGEHGWELANINKGSAVFSHAISSNLMEWGKYNPNQYKSQIGETSTGNNQFNFDKLVLPNVKNANDFISELQKLPNMAIRTSMGRH